MALIQGEKPSNKVYIAFGIIMVLLIVVATAATSGGGHTNTSPSQASSASSASSTQISQKSEVDTNTAKKIADSIKVQSTGYSYSSDKSQITYGFILDNSQKFTGTVSVSLSGVNGGLSDATTFTENNLAAGAGDIGMVSLSGRYTEYSYRVTVNGQTFSYAGGHIPVNE